MQLPLSHRRHELLRKQVRRMRRAAGLTQAELGARLKVDQSHISKLERGERYMDLLFYVDWCRACRQSPEQALAELLHAGA